VTGKVVIVQGGRLLGGEEPAVDRAVPPVRLTGADPDRFADSPTRLVETLEGTRNMNLLEQILWEG
jgi:hypothetical protein